jgi:GAF domain-containing protein
VSDKGLPITTLQDVSTGRPVVLTESGRFKRVSQTLPQQVEVLESLRELTQIADAPLEGNTNLINACQRLMEALDLDHVSLMLFYQGTSDSVAVAEYPDFGVRGLAIPMPHKAYQLLKDTRRPLVISRLADAAHYDLDRAVLERQGIRSLAFVPMFAEDEFIGVISLDVYHAQHEFSAEELETAQTLTAQLGLGVRNALLFEELRKRTGQLEFITQLGRRITSTFDRVQILRLVREETLKVIKTDLVAVALTHPTHPTLQLYIIGEAGTVLSEFLAELTGVMNVCVSGQPVVEANITAARHLDYQLLTEARMKSAAFVPLIAAGQSIGAFVVAHRDMGHFSTLDVDFLQQIGNQLAIALENARLYMEAARRADLESLANRLGNILQEYNDLPSLLLNTTKQLGDALHARRARVRIQVVPPGNEGLPSATPPPSRGSGTSGNA